MFYTTEESYIRMVLSCHHKDRRFGQLPSYPYSHPLGTSASSVSGTLAVVDIAIPMIGRTTVLMYTATPNTTSIVLSGHHDARAIGRVLQPIHPEEQPLSSRHVYTPAAPYRERLRDRPNTQSAGIGAAFASRHCRKASRKGKVRRTKSLSQSSRNGRLETRSETGYSGQCASDFHGAVHLGPMCKLWDEVPWNGESGHCPPCEKAPPGEQKSKVSTKVEDKPTSTSRMVRYTPADDEKIRSAEGARTILDRDRQAFPGEDCRGH